MVQMDFQARDVALKLVYYGPALSGKTTNLQQLHARLRPEARGRLLTLDTRDDRTLFFDLMPVHLQTTSGFRIRMKLYTVPGQVMHEATRRMVLKGADGIVFVADSQSSERVANEASFRSLRENLRANELDPDQLPLVVQYNKRDLPDAIPDAELDGLEQQSKAPFTRAIAVRGEGVVETFSSAAALTWDRLEEKHTLEKRLGVTKAAFLTALRGSIAAPATDGS